MEVLNELITMQFLAGIVLGVVISSLIPIKITFGDNDEEAGRVKAYELRDNLPRNVHRPKGQIQTDPPSPEHTMGSINRKDKI